jgi:uncharacterized membrane protein
MTYILSIYEVSMTLLFSYFKPEIKLINVFLKKKYNFGKIGKIGGFGHFDLGLFFSFFSLVLLIFTFYYYGKSRRHF